MIRRLSYALRHPRGGRIGLRQAIATSGQAGTGGDYARWVESALGAADSHVRYTPPDDDLILGLSMHARAADGALSETALQVLELIFPHIDNARRLVARAPDLASESEARLVVDRRGRIRAASPAAEALLAPADGLAIRDGRLRGARGHEDRQIAALVRSATEALMLGTAGGVQAIARPSGRRPWIVRAAALQAADGPFASFGPAAALTIVDPETGAAPSAAARWRAAFGFTPAEARLAETLLGGESSLRTAADRLGIAYATARVQLASVFDKAGVASQAQLARLLTRIGSWAMALWSAADQAASALA